MPFSHTSRTQPCTHYCSLTTNAAAAPAQGSPGGSLQPWAFLHMRAPEIQTHPDACSPAHKSSGAPSTLRDCTCPTLQFFAGHGGTRLAFAWNCQRQEFSSWSCADSVPQLNGAHGHCQVKAQSSRHFVLSTLSSCSPCLSHLVRVRGDEMLSCRCCLHFPFPSSWMLPRSLSFFPLEGLPPQQVAWLQGTDLAAAKGFCPLPFHVPLGLWLALKKALEEPGKAAAAPPLQPGPKRGVCPVVGRIRTCAGKPQWISSPSPSPLGHNYLLQPSLPCSAQTQGHHTNAQAPQPKAPVTNHSWRLLQKSLARASAKVRFNIEGKHNKVPWRDSLCYLQCR